MSYFRKLTEYRKYIAKEVNLVQHLVSRKLSVASHHFSPFNTILFQLITIRVFPKRTVVVEV